MFSRIIRAIAISTFLVLFISLVSQAVNPVHAASSAATGSSAVLPPVLASDSFSRVVSSGWGRADLGGSYVLSHPADFAVNGTVGTIRLPAPNSMRVATLDGVNAADMDITVRVSASKIAAGGSETVYLVARNNGLTSYTGRLRFATDGRLMLVAEAVTNGAAVALSGERAATGLTQNANRFVWLRMRINGANPTSIRLKAWPDGQLEPLAWQYGINDSTYGPQGSGKVGVQAFLASNATNAPVVFSFAEISVTPLDLSANVAASVATPSQTETAPPTSTRTRTPLQTNTRAATNTRTATRTWTATPTRTATRTRTATPTRTTTSTHTPTVTPTATNTAGVPSRSDRIYWGAYISGSTYGSSDAPWDNNTISAFQSNAGKAVSLIHWGQAWYRSGKFQPFDAKLMSKVRQLGVVPMIDWASWDSSAGMNQPDFSLGRIIDGSYDDYIRQWASAAKAWGYPFFLRFDWEMNGRWFPWNEGYNGNTAGQYAAAWRHIHDIFSAVGADNATWVWLVNVEYPGSTSLEDLYPGDDYVDWTGIDGYNWGTNPNKRDIWKSFKQVFEPTYDHLLRLAPDKPIMIGEVASTEQGGSKADWISDALKVELPGYFPRVKALVWMNWNVDNMDWVIESSGSAQAAFADGIAAPYYAVNEFGSLPPGHVPEP